MSSIEAINNSSKGNLHEYLGIEFTEVEEWCLTGKLDVKPHHLAPHGSIHGGTLVSFADGLAGAACTDNLPEEAKGFTTIELKTNFLGSVKDGVIYGRAKAIHKGRSTQVWDVEIWRETDGKVLAQFRCTQMIFT